MQEAEEMSENVEVAPPEAEPETPKEQAEQLSREEYQERNWTAARQRINDLEARLREKDDLIAQAILPKRKEIEEPELDREEFANYGGVEKVAKKTLQPLEEKVQKLERQLEIQRQRELIQSLRNKFPDFDEVVNPETLAIFEKKEPELATQISEITDPYKIGIQSYKYLKALNISDEVPSKRRQKEAVKMLDKNAKTLQSPQAYDKRPMAQAYRLTEDEKSKLYDEMMGFAAGASAVPPSG